MASDILLKMTDIQQHELLYSRTQIDQAEKEEELVTK
jgi:hypothetical protein